MGKITTQPQDGQEDELDLASELPRAMATVFGPATLSPKTFSCSSSRRSLGSAHGSIASGPSSIGTPLSFHTARSSVSYFTASLEIMEDRPAWLMGITQTGKSKLSSQKDTDRWTQTLQALKRLGLDNIEDSQKLKEAYLRYVCDTARRNEKVGDAIASTVLARRPVFSSEWLTHLHSRGILTNELDWSGRGEHVEYNSRDESKIPLRTEKILGHGQSAVVDCVRCRRIQLARKTIFCSRNLKKTDAISEVEHLQKLRHSHVIRIVGTYTINKRLAILLYPVAEWNLAEFMDEVVKRNNSLRNTVYDNRCSPNAQACIGVAAIKTFFSCISNAVSFIHDHNIRHMDFKPQNLLVRPTEKGNPLVSARYKIYIADFGIARAYHTAAESETDSPTSFTRLYAAPEVAEQDLRDYSSDIFSIGCVYMEMLATMLSCSTHNERKKLSTLRRIRFGDSSYPYYANIDHHYQAMKELDESFLDLLPRMLHPKRKQRPKAADLKNATRSLQCLQCNSGPEPFEAAEVTDIS
jgi:serine/threonine protein kinase